MSKKILKLVVILLFLLSLLSVIVSHFFTVDFVAKHFDDDGRIGDHVKYRIELFQSQISKIGIFFLILSLLGTIFFKRLINFSIKRKNVILGVMALICILVLIVLVGEIVLRLFFYKQINSEYGHGPGGLRFIEEIDYNSVGYRDIEHNLTKPEGIYRIAVIGDSFTFGNGINNFSEIYPRLLQKILDDYYGKSKFEVIIFAKPGYSTLDELEVLKNEVINYDPDLIVLGYYINDAEGLGSRVGFENLFFQHFTYPYEVGSYLYTHSYFYYFMESRMKSFLTILGVDFGSYINYTHHLYSESNPFYDEANQLFKEFVNESRSMDADVLVAMIPLFNSFDNYPFFDVTEQIKNLSENSGAVFVDTFPYFNKLTNGNADSLRVSFADGHMNEEGHRIMAAILFNKIRTNFAINPVNN